MVRRAHPTTELPRTGTRSLAGSRRCPVTGILVALRARVGRVVGAALLVGGVLAGLPAPGHAQERKAAADSVEVLREARLNQERFERIRRRRANSAPGGYRGPCQEEIGRICMRFDDGRDWWPEPEPPAVLEARDSLLVRLARAADALPGDAWITGQRVAYLAEAGRMEAAAEVTDACRSPEPGWCDALAGYVAHRAGDHTGAAEAFRRALDAMGPGAREDWTDPGILLNGDGRERLDGVGQEERASRIRRFWHWSDPLFLVPGNDRFTAHLARHVAVALQADAEGPFNLPWGDDLEEVVLRYGWVYGWEVTEPAAVRMDAEARITGQEHPESRRYLAPSAALADPPRTGPEDWRPVPPRRPRTGHAPDYAPRLLPSPVELARFPRGDTLVLAAWAGVPADTTFHAGHEHPPLLEGRRWRGAPDEHGLFALRDTTTVAAATAPGREGGLSVRLLPGSYLVSAEGWAPAEGRAGRMRTTLSWTPGPRDLPRVSDVLLVDPAGPLPATLEDAVPRMVPGPVQPGTRVGLAWELSGFRDAGRELGMTVEVEQVGAGVLTRVGRFLGVVGDPPRTGLSWREAAPEAPGPVLRSTWLELPAGLDEGRYRLTLRIEVPGRDPLTATRELQVAAPSR